jgi:hypothetical protein
LDGVVFFDSGKGFRPDISILLGSYRGL